MTGKPYSWAIVEQHEHGLKYRFQMRCSIASITMGIEPAERFIVDTMAWCLDQFGPNDAIRWLRWDTHFEFASQADATAFRLRWC